MVRNIKQPMLQSILCESISLTVLSAVSAISTDHHRAAIWRHYTSVFVKYRTDWSWNDPLTIQTHKPNIEQIIGEIGRLLTDSKVDRMRYCEASRGICVYKIMLHK